MKKSIRKGIIAVAATCMLASVVAGCSGSREMTDFTATSYETMYEVGDTVDFSGIVLSAIFNDGTNETVAYDQVEFYYNGQKIEDFTVLTQTVGKKVLEVRYNGKVCELTIYVNNASAEEGEKYYALSFASPDSVVARNNAVNNATDFSNSGDANYESKFFSGYETVRLVGDDNAFKFLPALLLEADDDMGADHLATAFQTNSTIYVKVDGEYKLLDSEKQDNRTIYSYDNQTCVIEAHGKNEYDFSEYAIGKEFKISVLPSADYLLNDEEFEETDAVSVEVKVVDAYNVYDVADLAVMENVTDGTRTFNSVGYWDSAKTAKGITADMVSNLKGIVLQNNLTILAKDLPSIFLTDLGEDYQLKYYYQSQGKENLLSQDEIKALGLGTVFLKDSFYYGTTASAESQEPVIFQRNILQGETFNFYGNYYSVDASKMPLVASFDATANGQTTNPYGTYFSVASLFKFYTQRNSVNDTHEIGGVVNMENLDVKGNANISDLLCAETNSDHGGSDNPVYAGGIILLKTEYNTLNLTNVISRTFFINYFGYMNSLHNYNNVKAYDSYSNSIWARGATTINVTKSNVERAGGPLFILCDMTGSDTRPLYGNVIVDADSKLESLVTGQESWFVSNGASGYASQIMQLDNLFGAVGLANKSICKTDGVGANAKDKINIICASIKDGDILTGISSGYFQYGNVVLDRRVDTSAYAQGLITSLLSTVQGTSSGYSLNIGSAFETSLLLAPVPVEVSPLGLAPVKLDGSQFTNPADMMWLASSEPAICLNMPTIGIMLGYYTLG